VCAKKTDERVFQRKVISQLLSQYNDIIDSIVTFENISLIGSPDIILFPKLDNQSFLNHYAMIIEIKTKIKIFDFLGQLIKYNILGPTYLALPATIYECVSTEYKNMLINILMKYNIGLITIESNNSNLDIKVRLYAPQDPIKELLLRELVIWNAVFKLITIIQQRKYLDRLKSIYNVAVNKLKSHGYEIELKRKYQDINIILMPMLPSLSLNGIAIAIAENPTIIKALKPNELEDEFENIIQKILKSPLMANAIDTLNNMAVKRQCGLLPSALSLLFSKPYVKISNDNICKVVLEKALILNEFLENI